MPLPVLDVSPKTVGLLGVVTEKVEFLAEISHETFKTNKRFMFCVCFCVCDHVHVEALMVEQTYYKAMMTNKISPGSQQSSYQKSLPIQLLFQHTRAPFHSES